MSGATFYNWDINGRGGEANDVGTIPTSMLVEKLFQTTDMPYDDTDINAYRFDVLANYRGDPPGSLGAFSENQRNRGSTQQLNLRNYGRVQENIPNHSEMFLETVFKDPNSIMYQPDQSKMIGHTLKRKDLYRFYDDSDNKIIEGTPQQYMFTQNLLRASQFASKNRVLNFETSYDAWATSSTVPLPRKAGVEYVEMTNEIVDPATLPGQTNRTVLASNLPSGKLRATPSHIIKVGEYGNITNQIPMGAVNYHKNRKEAQNSVRKAIEFRGNIVTKEAKHIITRLETENDGVKVPAFMDRADKKVMIYQGLKPPVDGKSAPTVLTQKVAKAFRQAAIKGLMPHDLRLALNLPQRSGKQKFDLADRPNSMYTTAKMSVADQYHMAENDTIWYQPDDYIMSNYSGPQLPSTESTIGLSEPLMQQSESVGRERRTGFMGNKDMARRKIHHDSLDGDVKELAARKSRK